MARPLNPESLASTRFVPFADSTDLRDDPARLRIRRSEDGYVFLRDVVQSAVVEPLFDQVADVFERWGVAERDGRELRWSGRELASYDPLPLYELPALELLIGDDALSPLCERLYGRPVWVGRNVIVFFALPDDPAYITPPHRDAFGRAWFGDGDYCTLWLPLAPIAFADGGPALLPGSQRDPIPEYGDERNDELPEYRGRRQEGRVPREARRAAVGPGTGRRGPKINAGHGLRLTIRDDEWLTGAFEPGDALFFSADMIHCGLPLRSDRLRVAIAARVYPGDGERPHQIPLAERLRRERAELSSA
jgi:hypothetical protein